MSRYTIGWQTTHDDRVEIFRAPGFLGLVAHQRWNWHVKSSNGEIIEHGEPMVRRIDAILAAERHHPREILPDAPHQGPRPTDSGS